MKKRFIPLLFIAAFQANGQTGLWSNIGVSKKWNKRFQTSLDLGYRQQQGIGFDKAYLALEQRVTVTDGIALQGAYRRSLNEQGDQLYWNPINFSNRFQIGARIDFLDAFDARNKRLSLTWTSLQQWEMQSGKRYSSIWRNKLALQYDIKNFPLSPCISAEHFYRWNADVVYTPTAVTVSGATVQWRYFAGFDIELGKHHALKLQYGFRLRSSGNQSIYRLSYSISI
ncbi:MAG: hypothetical protein RLZZ301_1715 [Bacteroidota bacterium]|jgi:hypothetical protein